MLSTIIYKIVLMLIFALVLVGSATAQSSRAPNTQRTFIAVPTDVPAGQIEGVTLKLSDDSVLTDSAAPDITVESLNPSQLTIENPHLSPDKKRLLFTVRPAANAFGLASLRVLKGDQKTSAMTEVEFIRLNITAGPAPPVSIKPTPSGIRRVDLMWSVLPDGIIKDNFGSETAKKYYGIQVVIGNNMGFDMQIISMAFRSNLKLPDSSRTGSLATNQRAHATASNSSIKGALESASAMIESPAKAPVFEIPVLDHRLVRGTIERDQTFGKRAKALGFITGIGTFTTGFLPFFHALGPRANFGTFTSILNGNLKEGFGLTVPDLTIRQLNRLENQVMRDELILSNNSQERTVVFVPKGIFDYSNSNDSKNKNYKPSIPEVMALLGEFTLVGRKVEYIDVEDRQIVVARGERSEGSTSSTTPSSISGISPKAGLLLDMAPVTITGVNFTDRSTVIFGNTPAASVKFVSPTTLMAVAPPHVAEEVEVFVITENGQKIVSPQRYTYFSELVVSGSDRTSGSATGGDTLKIFGTGFRSNTKVLFDDTQLPSSLVTVAADGKLITIKTPAHGVGNVKVTILNPSPYPSHERKELAGGFTYN
jgi:hypothetical protein